MSSPLIGPVFFTPSTFVNGIASFAVEDRSEVKNNVSDVKVMRPDAFVYCAGKAGDTIEGAAQSL